jgi:phage shock protein A
MQGFAEKVKSLNRKLFLAQEDLKKSEQSLARTTQELEMLKIKYEKLRLAKSMQELGENPVKVRAKINELIRDIDRCINRLNK